MTARVNANWLGGLFRKANTVPGKCEQGHVVPVQLRMKVNIVVILFIFMERIILPSTSTLCEKNF